MGCNTLDGLRNLNVSNGLTSSGSESLVFELEQLSCAVYSMSLSLSFVLSLSLYFTVDRFWRKLYRCCVDVVGTGVILSGLIDVSLFGFPVSISGLTGFMS